jgi:Fe-S-cluster containining protein
VIDEIVRTPRQSGDKDGQMQEAITFTFNDGSVISFTPPPPVEKPIDAPTSADCASCGACCLEAGYVAVSATDATPRALTRSPKGLGLSDKTLSRLGPRCMKRHLGGRCVALEGVVGKSVSCSIYSARPNVCRQFEAGSEGCLSAREQMRYKLETDRAWRGYGENWQDTLG